MLNMQDILKQFGGIWIVFKNWKTGLIRLWR
jgi:hypothetical protein